MDNKTKITNSHNKYVASHNKYVASHNKYVASHKEYVASHNKYVASERDRASQNLCNCPNYGKCPLDNKCLTSKIVYSGILGLVKQSLRIG